MHPRKSNCPAHFQLHPSPPFRFKGVALGESAVSTHTVDIPHIPESSKFKDRVLPSVHENRNSKKQNPKSEPLRHSSLM
jgi:hypothetical protein